MRAMYPRGTTPPSSFQSYSGPLLRPHSMCTRFAAGCPVTSLHRLRTKAPIIGAMTSRPLIPDDILNTPSDILIVSLPWLSPACDPLIVSTKSNSLNHCCRCDNLWSLPALDAVLVTPVMVNHIDMPITCTPVKARVPSHAAFTPKLHTRYSRPISILTTVIRSPN